MARVAIGLDVPEPDASLFSTWSVLGQQKHLFSRGTRQRDVKSAAVALKEESDPARAPSSFSRPLIAQVRKCGWQRSAKCKLGVL